MCTPLYIEFGGVVVYFKLKYLRVLHYLQFFFLVYPKTSLVNRYEVLLFFFSL